MTTTVVKTIGAAGNYADVDAWNTATQGMNLINRDEIQVGEILDNTVWPATEVSFDGSGNRDAGHYRHLRAASSFWYDPLADTGAKFSLSKTFGYMISVEEDYFRVSGVGVVVISSANSTHHAVIRFYTGASLVVGARVVACYVTASTGSAQTNTNYRLIDAQNTTNLRIRSCVLVGSDGGAIGGPEFGITDLDDATVSGLEISNTVVYGVDDSASSGTGIRVGHGASTGITVRNCAVAGCVVRAFDVVAGSWFDYCSSDDSTALGAHSKRNQDESAMWQDGGAGDYQPVQGGPLHRTGIPLPQLFLDSIEQGVDHGDADAGIWNIGPYDGPVLIGPSVVAPVALNLVTGRNSAYLARLWRIERTDDAVLRFTDCSHPLTVGGETYIPTDGMHSSAISRQLGLRTGDLEVQGVISDSRITEVDIYAGLYAGALVEIQTVDRRYPWEGTLTADTYALTSIEWDEDHFRGEVEGWSRMLRTPVGWRADRTCPHALGSTQCGVDMTVGNRRFLGVTIDSVSATRYEFDVSNAQIPGGLADEWFAFGRVAFITGANAGLERIVKRYTSATRRFRVHEDLPSDVGVGDTVSVFAGCDWLYTTCKDKFSNGINFGGYPMVPGTDQVYQGPDGATTS